MINPIWLTTFCTLVELQHFTATAKKLHMTQSGVSQHIKKLEQQLDTPLLIRDGKSFTLTDAGLKLYQQGGQLLHNFALLEGEVKSDFPHQGKVKISSPGSIGLRLYPFLLGLQVQYPKLSVDYSFAPNQDITDNLLSKKIDLGLSTALNTDSRLVSDKVADEPLVLVTPSSVTEVDWATLLQLGFISHPDAVHHSQLLLQNNFSEFEHIEQFTNKGFSNQISLILEPVSLDLGFTVLPLHAAKAFHAQGRINIHHLSVAVSETLYLSYHKNSVLSARVSFIKDEISQFLAGLT